MTDDEFRIDITDADIETARRQWQATCDRGEPVARVQRLFDVLQQLRVAQAQQAADDARTRES